MGNRALVPRGEIDGEGIISGGSKEEASFQLKAAVSETILSTGPVEEEVQMVLNRGRHEVLMLIRKLLASSGINGELVLSRTTNPEIFKAAIDKEEKDLDPEILELCLERLKDDYHKQRTYLIKVRKRFDFHDMIDSEKTQDMKKSISWEMVQEKLLENDKEMLKKAARMHGMGQLVGAFPDGRICIRDAERYPVIYAIDPRDKSIFEIRQDTPNREAVINAVKRHSRFANYHEIRKAVLEAGYTLPKNTKDFHEKGLVMACRYAGKNVCFVSGGSYKSANTIIDCGEVSRKKIIPFIGSAPIGGECTSDVNADHQDETFGAIRLLIG